MTKFSILLSLFLLSACAQVRVVTPNPRVETPETRGDQFKWKFAVAGGNAHMFRATGEGGARPPDLSHPQVRGHLDVHPGAYFGVDERVEIGSELNVLGAGINGIVKWQILGSGTQHASKGNLPIAIFLRTGLAQGNNNGDQKELFGSGGYNWSSKSRASFVHAGLSGGYRVSDTALLYGGFAGGKYWSSVDISQDANGSDPGGSYKASYVGNGTTYAVGASFSWRVVQFYVSTEYTRVDYGPTDDMEDLFIHAGVTFTPGKKD